MFLLFLCYSIVFTDFSKTTCTGSIIHDNVVITAAHCFVKENNGIQTEPELTTSFVVIGTKKMFATGYEQYLPIERVITHPEFRGWSSDLCLVYTFAGMTSDKPGSVIPLAGEKTSTHDDSNVTVLSWGHMIDIGSKKDWKEYKHDKCPDSTSIEDNQNDDIPSAAKRYVTPILEYKIRHRSNYETTLIPLPKKQLKKKKDTYRSYESRVEEKIGNKPAALKSRSQNMKVISRYLSGEERTTKSRHDTTRHRKSNNETTRNNEEIMYDEEIIQLYQDLLHNKSVISHLEKQNGSKKNQMQFEIESDQDIYWRNDSVTQHESEDKVKSYYKNWRRQMGTQQNQLTVEIFGFVNVQACKKLVEKAMPPLYDISGSNDVVCYATGDHFISDEDSGAPAVRNGQLVAVTVGGAAIDGDHVAVGMKMSCYCSWIADNIPVVSRGTRSFLYKSRISMHDYESKLLDTYKKAYYSIDDYIKDKFAWPDVALPLDG